MLKGAKMAFEEIILAHFSISCNIFFENIYIYFHQIATASFMIKSDSKKALKKVGYFTTFTVLMPRIPKYSIHALSIASPRTAIGTDGG